MKVINNVRKNFSNNLLEWYKKNKRELPWRNIKDPYKIWLSEIILQQTKISQGLPYYLKFVTNYPVISKLAEASEQEVLKMWEGLGYYSRARNLHKTAKIIVKDYNGVFPTSFDLLIKLPGIGDYTASAISSFSNNEIQPVVDGNVYRLLSRLIGIPTPINTTKSLLQFKEIANKLISKNNPSDFNQAIMDFGSLICKPKSPNCEECIYEKSCFAKFNQKIYDFPVKKNKATNKTRIFNYLVIKSDDGSTIIEKRINKDIWQNLFQFPLIESDKYLTKKNIKVELNKMNLLKNTDYKLTLFQNKCFDHKLTHQLINSFFWIIEVKSLKNNYIHIKNLNTFPFPKPITKFLTNYNW